MRFILGFAFLALVGCATGESVRSSHRNVSSTSRDCSPAECLLKTLIETRSNAEIAKQVDELQRQGLKPSGEFSSAFIGGSSDGDRLSYNYLVTTDYYNSTTFRTILVLANESDGKAILTRVLSQGELK